MWVALVSVLTHAGFRKFAHLWQPPIAPPRLVFVPT